MVSIKECDGKEFKLFVNRTEVEHFFDKDGEETFCPLDAVEYDDGECRLILINDEDEVSIVVNQMLYEDED